MAQEPFLINPPLIHDTLGLMRRNAKATRRKPYSKRYLKILEGKRKARKRELGIPLRREKFKFMNNNPLGEEILILGLNPKTKRRRSRMLDNAWYGHHKEHRLAALKGWRHRKKGKVAKRKVRTAGRVSAKRSAAARKAWRTRKGKQMSFPFTGTAARKYGAYGMNPRPKRRGARRMDDNVRSKARRMRDNAPRKIARRARARNDNPMYDSRVVRWRGKGRFRRNPELRGGLMKQTISALPHVGVGAASVITTALVPKFTSKVSSSPWVALGGQAAWVFGGGYLVNKFTRNKYGLAWMVGGGSVILADLVHKYILGGVMAGLGLGAYEPAGMGATSPLGAYEPAGVGALPGGFSPAMVGYRDTTGMSLAPEYVAGFGDFGLADAEYRG